MAAAVPRGTAANSPYLNVWVHYDYMVGPGYNDAPSAAAIQMAVDAFKAHGVTLHIDPQHTAIPAHTVIVPDWPSNYASQPGFDDPACTGPDAVYFSSLERQYFHPNSNHPWHYAVFGDYVYTDGPSDSVNCPPTAETGGIRPTPGMSGVSQLGFQDVLDGLGYSFVVALQGLRDAGIELDAPENARYEAATFMHELGHNLGLCHGGPYALDSCPIGGESDPAYGNYKPNYISVMNYAFNFGIPYATSAGSTTIAGWRVDYSDVQLPDLDESCLDETVGLQDTAHPTDITHRYGSIGGLLPVLGPIDWNHDGNTTDTCLSIDLNGDFGRTILSGADDWAWIHSRLTPPAVTNLVGGSPTKVGTDIAIYGVNLMLPATVIFAGGASTVVAANQTDFHFDMSPNTSLSVTVPAGARSGPLTVVTAEGKATSSPSLTITP